MNFPLISMMPLEHTTTTFCSIQSMPQIKSDSSTDSFRTGLISIMVEKAITDKLIDKISQSTMKYIDRGCSRYFIIRNQSANAFQLECAVNFKETRQFQSLRQTLRQRCINPCFENKNERGHCVEITLQAVDDEGTSIFERLRARAASGEWTLLYRKGDTTSPQPVATLKETGVARVGPGIALPVIVDPVARAGAGVDRPAAAAG